MLPGIAYYLSRWYRRSELAFRLSLYIVMAPLAGAFGGLLASGILKLDNVAGVRQWRMIFLVEGIITVGLSAIAFLTLTDRPETARWLSQGEKDLAIARVKSERVGQTQVLDGIDKAKMLRGIFSPTTMMVSAIFLLNNITVQGTQYDIRKVVLLNQTQVLHSLHQRLLEQSTQRLPLFHSNYTPSHHMLWELSSRCCSHSCHPSSINATFSSSLVHR